MRIVIMLLLVGAAFYTGWRAYEGRAQESCTVAGGTWTATHALCVGASQPAATPAAP